MELLPSALINQISLLELQGTYEKALQVVEETQVFELTCQQYKQLQSLKFRLLFHLQDAVPEWQTTLTEFENATMHVRDFTRRAAREHLILEMALFLKENEATNEAISCLESYTRQQKTESIVWAKCISLLLRLYLANLTYLPSHLLPKLHISESLELGYRCCRYLESILLVEVSSTQSCVIGSFVSDVYCICCKFEVYKAIVQTLENQQHAAQVKHHLESMSHEEKLVYKLAPEVDTNSALETLRVEPMHMLLSASINLAGSASIEHRLLHAKLSSLLEEKNIAIQYLFLAFAAWFKQPVTMDSLLMLQELYSELLKLHATNSPSQMQCTTLYHLQAVKNAWQVIALFVRKAKSDSRDKLQVVLKTNLLDNFVFGRVSPLMNAPFASEMDVLKSIPMDVAFIVITSPSHGNLSFALLYNPFSEVKKGETKEDFSMMMIETMQVLASMQSHVEKAFDQALSNISKLVAAGKKRFAIVLDFEHEVHQVALEQLLLAKGGTGIEFVARELCLQSLLNKPELVKQQSISKCIYLVDEKENEQLLSILNVPQHAQLAKSWKGVTAPYKLEDIFDSSKILRMLSASHNDTESGFFIYSAPHDVLTILTADNICSLKLNKVHTVVILSNAANESMATCAALLQVRGVQCVVFCKQDATVLEYLCKRIATALQQKQTDSIAKMMFDYGKQHAKDVFTYGFI